MKTEIKLILIGLPFLFLFLLGVNQTHLAVSYKQDNFALDKEKNKLLLEEESIRQESIRNLNALNQTKRENETMIRINQNEMISVRSLQKNPETQEAQATANSATDASNQPVITAR